MWRLHGEVPDPDGPGRGCGACTARSRILTVRDAGAELARRGSRILRSGTRVRSLHGEVPDPAVRDADGIPPNARETGKRLAFRPSSA